MLSTTLDLDIKDTKGVIRIRNSKKNRQHNSQKKKDKGTNNDLQNIHMKRKMELHESTKTPGELRYSGTVIRGKHSWFDALIRNTFYFIIF
jgi:hypothetical protein